MEVRKTVTVLFADISGSTALGERLDPESLRGIMSRYFEEMRSAIEQHGGTVEKFIGDAVMAVFGVPTVHEDDALRAVRAASQMREILATLNAELERDFGARLQIRIGINTGEVVAGDPSAGETFVTGDTVNVAARFEQTAEPGEIVFGEETHRLVRDAVQVEPVEPLELKGKTDRVPAFRFVDVTPGAPAFARRLDSPLVGREEELGRLQRVFDEAVAERACRMVTVLGDAGLGKSRLVTELVARVGGGARVLWARCLPYGEGITFWPVAELVKEAAAIDETDAPDAARSKLRALVADAEDGTEVAERVSAAIGLGGDGAGGGDIQETFWAVRRLLEILAAEKPLVVLFDDIHWAEPTFLDLLEYVTRFSAEHPLLLVCTARPDLRETRPDWNTLGETIVLEPLSQDESAHLIANLLGSVGLPADVQARITDAAEGNPLFVEEMLRKLIDERLLERDNGHWSARGDLSEVAVPGTINALLSARLDQLELEERAVIQRASVVGKVFWWGAVTELLRRTTGRASARTCRRSFARSSCTRTAPGSPERTRSGSATSWSATPPTVRCRSGRGRICTGASRGGSNARRATGSPSSRRSSATTSNSRIGTRPSSGRSATRRARSPRQPPNGSRRRDAGRSRTGTSRRPRTSCRAPWICFPRRIRAVSTSCSTSGSRSRSRTSRGRRPC